MAKKAKDDKPKNTKDSTSFPFVYGEAIPIPAEKQEELVKKYIKQIDDSIKARSERETEWLLNADASASTRPKKTKPWKDSSNVALGYINEFCEVVSDGIMTRANSGSKMYHFEGQDDYSMEHDEEVENWFNYITDTEEEFKFMDEEIKAFISDDNVCSLVNMERTERKVKRWRNLGVVTKVIDKIINVIGDYEIFERSEVQVKHVSQVLKISDCIPLGKGNDIQKMSGFAYFFFPTLDELKDKNSKTKNNPYYINLDRLEKKEAPEADKDGTKTAEKDANVQVKNLIPELKAAVIFAREDINGDGEYEEVVTVIEYNNKVFLRTAYLQFFDGLRPVSYGCANPDRDKFHGISFKSIGRPLQNEIEACVDQTIDNWDLVIKKIFTKVAGATITVGNQDGDDNEIYPGSIVEVSDKNDLGVLNVGSVDYNSLPLINKLENMLMRRFGLSVAGGSDMGDPRASGKKIGMLMAQGSQKIDGVFKRYNNMKQAYAKMLISRYAQYGDKLKYKVYLKPEVKPDGTIDQPKYVIKEIARDVLQDCNFKIIMNGMQYSTSKAEQKQEDLWLYETVLKSPLLMLPPMKLGEFSPTQLEAMYAFLKDLIDKYGKYNKERLLPELNGLKMSIVQMVTQAIEQQLKAQAAAALQAPKAKPHEIQHAKDMAGNVDMGSMMGGGTNTGGGNGGQ